MRTYNQAAWSAKDQKITRRNGGDAEKKKIGRRRDASSSTESPCHKWDTRRGGQESRPDPEIPFSFSRPRGVPRKFRDRVFSAKRRAIQPQLITCKTVIGPLKAWVNVATCRDGFRKFRDTMTHSARQTTKLNFLGHFARTRSCISEKFRKKKGLLAFSSTSSKKIGKET